MKSKYLHSFIKHTPCFFALFFILNNLFRTFLNTSCFNSQSVLPPRSQVIGQLGRIRFFGDDLYDLFSGRRKPRYDQVNVQFLIIIWPKLEQDLDISIDLQANLMRSTWFQLSLKGEKTRNIRCQQESMNGLNFHFNT